MKKLLLVLLALPKLGFGQNDDILNLQSEVYNINYRMDQHHKQFYNGVSLSILGIGGTAIGVISSVNPIVYIASAIALTGNIIIWNSHKWFKNKDMTGIKKEDVENKTKQRIKQLDRLLKHGEINQMEYDKAIEDLKNLEK